MKDDLAALDLALALHRFGHAGIHAVELQFDVLNLAADRAKEMMMPVHSGVVSSSALGDDGDFNFTGLNQGLQGLIDRGQRNGRISLFNGLVDQFSRGVIALMLLNSA